MYVLSGARIERATIVHTITPRSWYGGDMALNSPSLYRVTASEVGAVRVGSFVIDDDTGPRRDWSVFQPASGSIQSFVGQRTHRLCPDCFHRQERLVRVLCHDHPHGEGPILDPDA
jgi:hypothetical protein